MYFPEGIEMYWVLEGKSGPLQKDYSMVIDSSEMIGMISANKEMLIQRANEG